MPYEKLVRDGIPLIMQEAGSEPDFRIARTRELSILMRRKIWEEVDELMRARKREKIVEESADVLEIVEAYCELHGITMDEVMRAKKQKLKEKGGFEKRIVVKFPGRRKV